MLIKVMEKIMTTESGTEEFLFSQEDANSFLAHIARILVYRLDKGMLLELYQDIGHINNLKLADADDGNNLLYEFWEHSGWLKLMREPFKELVLEILSNSYVTERI